MMRLTKKEMLKILDQHMKDLFKEKSDAVDNIGNEDAFVVSAKVARIDAQLVAYNELYDLLRDYR